jgi:hypothetical protein
MRSSDRALSRLTREHDGLRHIVDQPPVVKHLSHEEKERLFDGLEAHLQTLPPQGKKSLGKNFSLDISQRNCSY